MITELDKNTALILIDMQQGILHPPVAHSVTDLIANSVALINGFRKADLPIVLVTVNPATAPWTLLRQEGSPANQSSVPAQLPEGFTVLHPDLPVHPHDIYITKQHWNAFAGTPLHALLQERNVTGIVLAGVATSIGVEGTARAASELLYHVTFVTDAMSDRKLEAHNHSIQTIFPRLGESGTTDEVLAKL